MNYGDLIRDAFRICWRNRFLWVFGFFVGGTGTNFVGNIPPGGGSFDGGDFERSGVPVFAAQMGPDVLDSVALIVALVVVAVVLVLFFIVMNLISQGALAESVAAMDRGEGRRFSSGWRAGLRNVWRVLGYYVIFFLIALGLLIAAGVPLAVLVGGTFALTESVGARVIVAVLAGLLGIALIILVFIPLSIIGQYALREIVVRREGVFASVGGGYGVFRRNIGRSLLLWLINLGLGIGIGIAVLVGLLIVGLVLFLPTIVLAFAEYTRAAVVTGIVAGVILLPILLVVSGATGAFFHSYWTLAYLRLTGHHEGPEPAQSGAVA
jgi:membrane-anchored glycerophosphoryl diester phosphodiesterase (GDPDase)